MLSIEGERIGVLVVDEMPVIGAGVRALLAGREFTVDDVTEGEVLGAFAAHKGEVTQGYLALAGS
jgi:hypothetical protein